MHSHLKTLSHTALKKVIEEQQLLEMGGKTTHASDDGKKISIYMGCDRGWKEVIVNANQEFSFLICRLLLFCCAPNEKHKKAEFYHLPTTCFMPA